VLPDRALLRTHATVLAAAAAVGLALAGCGGSGGGGGPAGPTGPTGPTGPDACAFSTAGSPWLAFASLRAGSYDAWAMRLDGTCLAPLTDDPALDLSPSWALDGRVAWGSSRGGAQGLVVRDPATGAEARLDLGDLRAASPAFSPDGARLAFEGHAAGAATFKYGTTRRWTDGLTMVLACGHVIDVVRGEVRADPGLGFELECGCGVRTIKPGTYTMPAVATAVRIASASATGSCGSRRSRSRSDSPSTNGMA